MDQKGDASVLLFELLVVKKLILGLVDLEKFMLFSLIEVCFKIFSALSWIIDKEFILSGYVEIGSDMGLGTDRHVCMGIMPAFIHIVSFAIKC